MGADARSAWSLGLRPTHGCRRLSPTRRDLAVASGSRLEVLALGGGGQAMRHIGPVGPRHQLCDLAEVQPRLRLRARLVRELAARSRPSRRRRLAGTNQPSTGAVKCNPASARRAAPRAGRGHVAARLPACSGSIVARRNRRVVASTMGAHRCTSTPIEVVGAPGGAVVLQQRRRGSPAGACGLPLASRCRSEVRDATPRHHDTLGRDDLGFQDSEGTASKSGHSSQSSPNKEHVRTTSGQEPDSKKTWGKLPKW